MGEPQFLAHAFENATAHEFFDRLGGLLLVEAGRALEESELELVADDGGHGGDLAGTIAQRFEVAANRLANTMWQRDRGERRERRLLGYRAKCLDHDQRVPFAGDPHLIDEYGADVRP